MKTNVSIELSDDQRLNLARKYKNSKSKKLLTRSELNQIVQDYVQMLLDVPAQDKEVKPVGKDPLLNRSWNSLSQLREYLIKQNEVTIVGWDFPRLVIKERDGTKFAYGLAFHQLSKRRVF
tara:strand:+ start:529 stop:891 length:363 start_codon:yes stop_codon:yes gene_type:complete